MVERRTLKIENWDQARAELQALLKSGYTATGKWNLEQIARHLQDWLTFPIDGFPSQPLPMRMLAAAMKYTFGLRLFKKILASGKMAQGVPTLSSTVYKSTSSDVAAVAELEAAMERFQKYRGEIHLSPLFGPMDKPTAERLQFIHFAHHLNCLVPNE